MRILVTGSKGQVGWELVRSLLPLGDVIAADRGMIDLADLGAMREKVREIRPDIIVNAAAYTAVDRAEQEEQLATIINGEAPRLLAEEMALSGGLLVHYSTDYVFDGAQDQPYRESDTPNPLNAYGRSKLKGEQGILESKCDFLIFRTSWVYAARGNNFLRTIIRLTKERDKLGIVSDQYGTPTWARLISDVTAHCIAKSMLEKRTGEFTSAIYNLTSTGNTSWYGFANKIYELAQAGGINETNCLIQPIGTQDYPLPAVRPVNSTLDVSKLEQKFGINLPEWDIPLSRCVDEVSC